MIHYKYYMSKIHGIISYYKKFLARKYNIYIIVLKDFNRENWTTSLTIFMGSSNNIVPLYVIR